MKFKKWIPEMMLGAMMAAMVTVPVMADNINSGSTPPIEFSRVSSTSADSSSGGDSGKVYDFKDSKTSGVVTVTKKWDDSSSNDERTIPDISISTEKPRKSTLGYGITYYGNGLTFADGSSVNDIVVNSSGKIVSGQYKELSGSLGWYSDKACTQKVEIGTDGLPVSGVVSDLDLYAKPKTFVLKTVSEFNDLIPKGDSTNSSSAVTDVIFTDKEKPADAELVDVDADGDGGVVGWLDGTAFYVSSQTPGQKVLANKDCSYMFFANKNESKSLDNINHIDFMNLDTSLTENMSFMFKYLGDDKKLELDCSGFDTGNVTSMESMFDTTYAVKIDVSGFNTSKVTTMESMFNDSQSIRSLDLSSFDTSNVTNMFWMLRSLNLKTIDVSNFNTSKVQNMGGMFNSCHDVTKLDLTNFDTSSCTDMGGMFINCEELTELICPFDTSKVTDMYGMFSMLPKLTSLDLSTFNTSKVKDMGDMFEDSYNLTRLKLGAKFVFVGSNYHLPRGTWYASDGTAYTSNGYSCTIPNNKADTYIRK